MPRPPHHNPTDLVVNGSSHHGRLELAYRSVNLLPWHNKSRSFYGKALVRPKTSYDDDPYSSEISYVIFSRNAETEKYDVIAGFVPDETSPAFGWNYFNEEVANPTQKHHILILRRYLTDPQIAPYVFLSGDYPQSWLESHPS